MHNVLNVSMLTFANFQYIDLTFDQMAGIESQKIATVTTLLSAPNFIQLVVLEQLEARTSSLVLPTEDKEGITKFRRI